MLSSTLSIALRCRCCGKWLKETEHYFYYNRCTECVHQEFLKMLKEKETN